MAKIGRPKKKINAKVVETLASIQCTNEEIAQVCECSSDTLTRRFAEHIKKGKNVGKSSLRRLQWEKAKAGNTTMQIWLGKQVLGQRDRIENIEGQPLPFDSEEFK